MPVIYQTGLVDSFAIHGDFKTQKISSYRLMLITRVDSGIKQPKDLIGKKIAHTTPASNSGNLAPRAYFPKLGLVPDKDYQVVYSNGHERSIVGVLHGFYEGAAVASDQFDRMVTRGEIRASLYRVLWQSEAFPTNAFWMIKDINPAISKKIRECTFSYKITAAAGKLLDGADRFLPVNYEKDYAQVRYVLERSIKP